MNEIESAIAAGIFRGEGTIQCRLYPQRKAGQMSPVLSANVQMCDRESVELVARVWGSRPRQTGSSACRGGRRLWQTSMQGNLRVRDALVPWIARGWLGKEKREQYFDAVARHRRARRVFISVGRRRPAGKAREAFS